MSEKTVERLHHPFSPSKLQYSEACPHYTGDVSSNTEASEAGTKQHDASEDPTDIDDPTLEDHQFEAVHRCKNYRDNLIASLPGCAVIKEEYLPIDGMIIRDSAGHEFKGTTGGYTDVCIISADEKVAHVIDWKFGLWSVEPTENNLQGMAYLLGLWFRFRELQEVTVHFVLPHRDEIDFHTFKRSEFSGMLLRVKTVVARAQEAVKDQQPGGWKTARPSCGSCLFCGNKGKCEKVAEIAIKIGKKYAPLSIPEQLTPSLMLDPVQAKPTMELAQVMEGWAKGVRGRITAKAIEDENFWPESYVLKSRTDTKVLDWRKMLAAARKNGVSQAKIKEAIKITVKPIYEGVRATAIRGQKEAAEEQFRNENLAAGITELEQPIYFLERMKS